RSSSKPILSHLIVALLHLSLSPVLLPSLCLSRRLSLVPFIQPFGVDEPEKPAEPVPKAKEQKKPRNIDFFMQELKQEQELREQREKELKERAEARAAGKPYGNEGQPSLLGSEGTDLLQPFPDGVRRRPSKFDTGPPLIATPPGITTVSTDDGGDPLTTNLYVGNLSPKVDENFLLRTFGRFGPIASVKIMWPRTEEEHRRQRNCGFVAFMKRADAAKAKNEMDCMWGKGGEWGDMAGNGWGAERWSLGENGGNGF
ncbi:unnamed protein product, partial [Closterium sp. NIES-65]